MGSRLGVQRGAARRAGVTFTEYLRLRKQNLKYCWKCEDWHTLAEFGKDSSRADGLSSTCLETRRVKSKALFYGGPPTAAHAWRAADAVRAAIIRGDLPPVRERLCVDCCARARHYHHENGYEKEALLDVVPLCFSCHRKRHWRTNGKDSH